MTVNLTVSGKRPGEIFKGIKVVVGSATIEWE